MQIQRILSVREESFCFTSKLVGSDVIIISKLYLNATGSSLIGITALCPWARHINPSLELVKSRKTRLYITKRLLVGHKESNKKKTFTWSERIKGVSGLPINLCMHASFKLRGALTCSQLGVRQMSQKLKLPPRRMKKGSFIL